MQDKLKRRKDKARGLDEMSPREIVEQLDRYVVGQQAAKKAVAIALRNRIRRQKLDEEMAQEVAPKNIIMIGPTGVGKTEIARRLAKLTASPFLKIEASKFTEVGYVGRDVESMVRDLMELAVAQVKAEERHKVQAKAEAAVEERLLDMLLPGSTPIRLASCWTCSSRSAAIFFQRESPRTWATSLIALSTSAWAFFLSGSFCAMNCAAWKACHSLLT